MGQTIDYSLHTHTTGFDGRDTIENMVLAAKLRDIKTFGISNHFILHRNIKKSPMYKFAVMGNYDKIYNDNRDELIEKFKRVSDEIKEMRKKYPDMTILFGMEMDLFKNEQWTNDVNYAVRVLQPDYVIGARHFIEAPDGTLLNVHDIRGADSKTSGHLLRSYYQFYDDEFADIINRELKFDIAFMAHVDLPRKLGLYNPVMEWYAVEKLSQIGVPAELNTSLIKNKNYLVGDMEPTVFKAMAETKIPVVLSDDAHGIAGVKKCFGDVFDMAQKFGITNICTKASDLPRFIGVKSR